MNVFTDGEVAYIEGGERVGLRLGASYPFDPAWMPIRPRRILTWGIDPGLSARQVA